MNKHELKGVFKATGANIYFETKGVGENLLMLHAGIADSRMWDQEFHLLSKDFRVVRLDLPGYGFSEFTGGSFSYNQMINELLSHMDMDNIHILAASFGGKLAIDYYIDNPTRCLSLALSSPAVGGWDDSLYLQQYEVEEERLLEEGKIEAAVLLNYDTWIVGEREHHTINPKVKELVIDMQMKSLTKPDSVFPYEEVEAEDNITRMKDIKIPVVVINGIHDVQDFHEIADLICREIPSAKRVTIPNAAHLANLESSDLFNEVISDFFWKNLKEIK